LQIAMTRQRYVFLGSMYKFSYLFSLLTYSNDLLGFTPDSI